MRLVLARALDALRDSERRFPWLLGASALLHLAAFQLTALIPERRHVAPPPIPVELVAPPAPAPSEPEVAGDAPAPPAETPEDAPAPAAAEPPQDAEAAPEARATPPAAFLAPEETETEAGETDGDRPRYAPYNDSRRAPGLAPYREGRPPPGVALARVVRSLDCRRADPRSPRIAEICAGVTPAELIPRGARPRIVRDAEFEALIEAREALRRRNAEQPLDFAEEKPGCVAGVSGPDC